VTKHGSMHPSNTTAGFHT